MKTYEDIKFRGKFRDYQQRVIDNAQQYLSNGKIHIVAAPGSGKTILGLELIRQLNQPALILSPSITIKNQWQDRLSMFLDKNANVEDYASLSLKHMKLITSSTYQALHSAINRLKEQTAKNEENDVFEDEKEDYTNFDLIKAVKRAGIKTICLDEAHHLRTEWYKSLKKFLTLVGSDINIIALTATPPYDSNDAEWDNYISLCGEIDEEVQVPELVKKKNLCPHQDFVYYNLPTIDEQTSIDDYVNSSWDALKEIASSKTLVELNDNALMWFSRKANVFYDNLPIIVGMYALFEHFELHTDKHLLKYLKKNTNYKKMNLSVANKWLDDWQANQEMYGLKGYVDIEKILKRHGLIHNKKITLQLNQKIIKETVSSQSKLDSIIKITKAESNNLKDNLRMLILTDYIKKEGTKLIGTDQKYNCISVVSIFENLRRCNLGVKFAVLTGSLVILNKDVIPALKKLADKEKCQFSTKELNCDDYVICEFKGASNKQKVNFVTQLFQKGKMQVVIGTKSLLGEGWDSPNINSLILASFVGSYMLSNQMRGRAIRIDNAVPDKVSNIWHLVTVIPSTDKTMNYVADSDYEVLIRRFKSFFAPNYKTKTIETGYERTMPLSSFDATSVAEHNKTILDFASNRAYTKQLWDIACENYENKPFKKTVSVKKTTSRKPKIKLYDLFRCVNWTITTITFLLLIASCFVKNNWLRLLGMMPFAICFAFYCFKFLRYFMGINNFKSFTKILSRAVIKTMKDFDMIEKGIKVYFKNDSKSVFQISVSNCSNKQQENQIITALQEILSPIDNPRYIVIRKNSKMNYDYKLAFQVPKIISTNKAYATRLNLILNRNLCQCGVVYTKTEQGNKELQRARKMSVINSLFSLNNKQTQIKNK